MTITCCNPKVMVIGSFFNYPEEKLYSKKFLSESWPKKFCPGICGDICALCARTLLPASGDFVIVIICNT